jgi:adenylate cyclase
MTDKYMIEYQTEGCVYISEGQTILAASLAAGIPLFHVCGGKAKCSTRRVLIIEGEDYLTAPNAREKLLKDQMNFPPNVRLACQSSLTGGPVRLKRIIQDETDIGLYVGSAAGTSTQQLGKEKELVLFFLDIRNFTPFVETHLAFDVIHIIRKLFSVCQSIIKTNGGRILETAGDGIYAIFGNEQERIRSVQSAVQSGLSILADLEVMNSTYFITYFEANIQVGIGIHIGKVVSGSVTIENENRLIVMGYPVNIASRLQAATRELNNNFIVSEDIYNLLPDRTVSSTPTQLEVKGVSTPLTVHLIGKPYVQHWAIL